MIIKYTLIKSKKNILLNIFSNYIIIDIKVILC